MTETIAIALVSVNGKEGGKFIKISLKVNYSLRASVRARTRSPAAMSPFTSV